LCVVDVTTSTPSFKGLGCKPAAINPAMCAISARTYAPTSLPILTNSFQSIILGYADAPQIINLGFTFKAISLISS